MPPFEIITHLGDLSPRIDPLPDSIIASQFIIFLQQHPFIFGGRKLDVFTKRVQAFEGEIVSILSSDGRMVSPLRSPYFAINSFAILLKSEYLNEAVIKATSPLTL
jgi:hypothetical protein